MDLMQCLFTFNPDCWTSVPTPLTTSSASQIERVAFDAEEVGVLEQWIDKMEQELPKITNFILPSGGKAASFLHVARTQARRAERQMVTLVEGNDITPVSLHYINRLSDFLFVAARWISFKEQDHVALYSKSKGLFGMPSSTTRKKRNGAFLLSQLTTRDFLEVAVIAFFAYFLFWAPRGV